MNPYQPNFSNQMAPMQQPAFNPMMPPYQSFSGPMMPGGPNSQIFPAMGMMGGGNMNSQSMLQQQQLQQSQQMFTRRGSIDAAQVAVAETIKAKKDFPFMSRCTLLNLCMDIYENMVNTPNAASRR